MPFHALVTIPLIRELSTHIPAKQVWYADDSSATGSFTDVRKRWDTLVRQGPAYGYFTRDRKTWLVVKESAEIEARGLFGDRSITITTAGRSYLGAPLGTQSYMENFVCSKVDTWTSHVRSLAKIAQSQPHAAYAAFIRPIPIQP